MSYPSNPTHCTVAQIDLYILLYIVEMETLNSNGGCRNGGATSPSKSSQVSPQASSQQQLRRLTDGLLALYELGLLTDVTLTVGGEKFPCHRNVLAASSPYFRSELLFLKLQIYFRFICTCTAIFYWPKKVNYFLTDYFNKVSHLVIFTVLKGILFGISIKPKRIAPIHTPN